VDNKRKISSHFQCGINCPDVEVGQRLDIELMQETSH
jgi:hypothetical protein